MHLLSLVSCFDSSHISFFNESFNIHRKILKALHLIFPPAAIQSVYSLFLFQFLKEKIKKSMDFILEYILSLCLFLEVCNFLHLNISLPSVDWKKIKKKKTHKRKGKRKISLLGYVTFCYKPIMLMWIRDTYGIAPVRIMKLGMLFLQSREVRQKTVWLDLLLSNKNKYH